MDRVGANEANKRRLPPWMMGAPANNLVRQENKVDRVGAIDHGGLVSESEVTLHKQKTRSRKIMKKSWHEDEETCISKEASTPKSKKQSRKVVNKSLDEGEEANDSVDVYAPKSKRESKRIQKGTLQEDGKANADSSCTMEKCDRTKRKRKTSSQVVDSDVNNTGNEKLIEKYVPQRKKKGIFSKLTQKEVSSSCTDSGRQLLMEDLIRIAEEYVNADSRTEQEQQKVGACMPEEKLSAADTPFDEPASSFDIPRTKYKADIEAKSTSPTSSEQVQNNSIFSDISRTGDVAQDMLNLLLGPLLMKPVDESKKTLNSDDVLFDRPVQNQNHVAEELAPPVKKKTSLKDKVLRVLAQEATKYLINKEVNAG